MEHDEDDVPYQGCMAIDAGDRNRVKNILFEDIRVEHIQEGQLFHLRKVFKRGGCFISMSVLTGSMTNNPDKALME